MQSAVQRKILLTGLFLGLFFASLDQTVVGTAMPRIIGDLGGLNMMTWVTTAYMLTSTIIVPIAGKLADLYGRRVVYVGGLGVFLAGSALCGISSNMTQLILYRGLQGLGGGIMMPLSMTIIGDIFPPEQRGKWQGLIGAVFGLSSIVGPAIGGWIVDYISWHWVFFINLPIGMLAAGTISIGLRGEKRLQEQASIDYRGALYLILSTLSLLLGLNLGGAEFPWLSWPEALLLGSALLLGIAFVLVEKRAAEPILSLALFNNKVFVIANIIGFLMGLGIFGALLFTPLFWQGVIGATAIQSGNMALPMMFANIVASVLGGRLADRASLRVIFAAGMAFMAAGFYLLGTMVMGTPLWLAAFYLMILGFGGGLIMPIVTLAVQNVFSDEQRSMATSATQFFRSIGSTLGMTVLGVLFNTYSLTVMAKEVFPLMAGTPDLQTGVMKGIADKAYSDPHSLFNLLLSPQALSAIPLGLQPLFLPPLKIALAESLRLVFLAAMAVSIIGVIFSLRIGNIAIVNKNSGSLPEGDEVMRFAEELGAEDEIGVGAIGRKQNRDIDRKRS